MRWWPFVMIMACGGGAPPTPVAEAPPEAAPAPGLPLQVVALSYPAAWLAEQVGGDRVAVTVLPPPGADLSAWQPSPTQIAGLVDYDLVVANGAGYEAWTEIATLPSTRLVVASRDTTPLELPSTHHSHGGGVEHTHGGVDPRTWTDPLGYARGAFVVAGALASADPDGVAVYKQGRDATMGRLETVGKHLKAVTEDLRGRRLVQTSPAFRHLARRLGVPLDTLALDPFQAPDEVQQAAIAAWLAEHGAPAAVIWTSAPTPEATAPWPEGVAHVVLDPMERPKGGAYDPLAAFEAAAEVLAAVVPD